MYESQAPKYEYVVNDRKYNIGYFLSNDIYLRWATIVKTTCLRQGEKVRLFTKHQGSSKKDVEKAFGVLQSRFAIIHNPAWYIDKAEIENDN